MTARWALPSGFARVPAKSCLLPLMLVSLLSDAGLSLATGQTRLEAAYRATLLGLPIGEISWTLELHDDRYRAAARGAITGFLRIFSDGRGDVSVHGVMSEGRPAPSNFELNLIAGKWSDNVRTRTPPRGQ